MTETKVNQTWESPPVGIPLYLEKSRQKNTWNTKQRRFKKTPRLKVSYQNANGWEELESATCKENYSGWQKLQVSKKSQELRSPSEWDLPIPTEWKKLQSPSESDLPIPTGWQRLQSPTGDISLPTKWNKKIPLECRELQNSWGLNNLSWDSPATQISNGWDA